VNASILQRYAEVPMVIAARAPDDTCQSTGIDVLADGLDLPLI
jgi:hypothetical protein